MGKLILIDREEDFEKEQWEANRVRSRAVTIVRQLDWVSYVGLVVRTVQINTIPAFREENLRSEAILTFPICGGETRLLGIGSVR
jgi:hypothetical protein